MYWRYKIAHSPVSYKDYRRPLECCCKGGCAQYDAYANQRGTYQLFDAEDHHQGRFITLPNSVFYGGVPLVSIQILISLYSLLITEYFCQLFNRRSRISDPSVGGGCYWSLFIRCGRSLGWGLVCSFTTADCYIKICLRCLSPECENSNINQFISNLCFACS